MKKCRKCNGLGYKLTGEFIWGIGNIIHRIMCKKCHGKGVK